MKKGIDNTGFRLLFFKIRRSRLDGKAIWKKALDNKFPGITEKEINDIYYDLKKIKNPKQYVRSLKEKLDSEGKTNEKEEITENRTIRITDKSEKEIQVAKISESNIETSLEEILNNYSPVIEKIVVEQVEIPYETITKNVAEGATDTSNRVIRQGKKHDKKKRRTDNSL